jgi:hypothetical protein
VKPETAGLVLLGTSGGGLLAWLLAVWGCLRLRRPGPGEHEEPGPAGESRRLALRISVVKGTPADLVEGLGTVFEAAGRGEQSMPLFAKRERDHGLTVTSAGHPGLGSVPVFSVCRVTVRELASGSCEIAFNSEYTGLFRSTVRRAGVLLAAGLGLLLGGSLLLWLATPGMAKAAGLAQLVQISLLAILTAPWVLYALYRRARRTTEIFLDSAAAHAAALAEARAAKRRKSTAQS